MITVKLHGALAKTFGRQFKFEVKDTAEAFRALVYQIKGFRQFFQAGYYKVRIGNHFLDSDRLQFGLYQPLKKHSRIHIIPVVKGAGLGKFFKKAGVVQVLLGAALIGASFFIPSAGLLGGLITKGMVFGMGAALALGGVSQMLSPTPKMPGINHHNDEQKSKSSAFSGLENLTPQGRPVPLVYGEILTGGIIISQGIETHRVNAQGVIESSAGSSNQGENESSNGTAWGVA